MSEKDPLTKAEVEKLIMVCTDLTERVVDRDLFDDPDAPIKIAVISSVLIAECIRNPEQGRVLLESE